MSISITVDKVNEVTLGRLIALFERAVGYYASYVNINAYHQPGVEAGKAAAVTFLDLLGRVRSRLVSEAKNAEQVAFEVDGDPEDVYHCLVHLANNGEAQMSLGKTPAEDYFQL
jgi:glucose-6-phosphate isomerase